MSVILANPMHIIIPILVTLSSVILNLTADGAESEGLAIVEVLKLISAIVMLNFTGSTAKMNMPLIQQKIKKLRKKSAKLIEISEKLKSIIFESIIYAQVTVLKKTGNSNINVNVRMDECDNSVIDCPLYLVIDKMTILLNILAKSHPKNKGLFNIINPILKSIGDLIYYQIDIISYASQEEIVNIDVKMTALARELLEIMQDFELLDIIQSQSIVRSSTENTMNLQISDIILRLIQKQDEAEALIQAQARALAQENAQLKTEAQAKIKAKMQMTILAQTKTPSLGLISPQSPIEKLTPSSSMSLSPFPLLARNLNLAPSPPCKKKDSAKSIALPLLQLLAQPLIWPFALFLE